MDCKFYNCESKKYSCILCGNRVCNIGKFPNDGCEQLKDKIKTKDMVTQSIKRKGKIFRSFLGHGMFLFY